MLPEQREIVERWITALESGEYEQARGSLVMSRKGFSVVSDREYTDEECSFCCIGVLGRVRGSSIKDMSTSGAEEYDFVNEVFNDPGAANTLWKLNDRQRLSFEDIANYIRENYLV